MREQLISFETAKLAKEKGFIKHADLRYMSRSIEGCLAKIGDLTTLAGADISAPPQSLLQKWLREVYGIHIDVRCDLNGGYYIYVMMTKGETLYSSIKTYETYEEALEIGLFEALNKINNERNKT